MSSVGSLQQNCFEMSTTQCQCVSLIKQRHGVIKFVINKEKEFEFNFFFHTLSVFAVVFKKQLFSSLGKVANVTVPCVGFTLPQ